MSYIFDIVDGERHASLTTKHGTLTFPTFMPVTTFGDKYPLDKLVQPYLKRMSQCLMVSHFYAQQMKKRPNMPIFIDSGGFAGLLEGSEIVEHEDCACIRSRTGEEIHPLEVLHFQIRNADIGATLDFIIPPGLDEAECIRRQELTIKNALYAQKHNIVGDLVLYASLQCWDEESARRSAKTYAEAGFEGIAIGGLVPRSKDPEYIKSTVRAVREEAPDCAIHVFGCGNTEIMPELIALGADSFDSSSYVRAALEARDTVGGGLHSNLYAALRRLYEVNAVVCKSDTPITKAIPNMALCQSCQNIRTATLY